MDVKALQNFRVNLRHALKNRELSYRTFGEQSGLTYIYIFKICNPSESGKPEPSLAVCDKIADTLGHELATMLGKPADFREAEAQMTTAVQ